MFALAKTAKTLRSRFNVQRCALVTNGGDTISVVPLHGLNEEWHSVTTEMKEYHDGYPGYISSKDGSTMENSRLDLIYSQIQAVSGISTPYNTLFDGNESDKIFLLVS